MLLMNVTMKNKFKYLGCLWQWMGLILPLIIVTSCMSDSLLEIPEAKKGEIILTIELPANIGPASGTGTRALSADKENYIKEMDVLLFSTVDEDSKFVDISRCSEEDIITEPGNSRKKTVTVKVKYGGTFDLVLLANAQGMTGGDFKGMTKQEVLQSLTTTVTGKWPSNVSRPFPMWGEINNIEIYDDIDLTEKQTIKMIRMVARVDVQLDETVKNFQISSIHVYNYNTRGQIAPDKGQWDISDPDKPKATSPHVPSSSVLEKGPLLYEVDAKTFNGSVSEIYLFEYENHSNKDHAEVKEHTKRTCLVVGGNFDANGDGDFTNDGKETFYRMDFSDDSGESPKYLDVIRNHCYQFKIMGVSMTGYDNPEDAFLGSNILMVKIIPWNLTEQDITIEGQYFFGIETSDLKMGWEKGASITVPFTSNLKEEDIKNALKLTWKNSNDSESPDNDIFSIEVDYSNKKLTIRSKQENPDYDDISRTLIIRFLKHKFDLTVIQLHRKTEYMIANKTFTANGAYIRNVENTPGKNTAVVRLYGTNSNNSIAGKRYALSSKIIDGYWVDATGVFDNVTIENDIEYQDVTIDIKGKTTNPKNKVLTVVTDAENPTMANIIIPVAYIPKTILGLFGENSTNRLESNANFMALIKETGNMNFGTDHDAVVKSEIINYIESTDINLGLLIESNNPDVIIIGDGYEFDFVHFKTLSKFLTTRQDEEKLANGVVIAMNTTQDMKDFMVWIGYVNSTSMYFEHGMYPGSTLGHRFYDFTPSPPSGEILIPRFQIFNYTWDLVSNGPFGNIGAKFWLGNTTDGFKLTYPVNTKILKYSGMVPYGSGYIDNNTARRDYGTTFFRAADHAFAWIGYPGLVTDQTNWHFEANGKIADNSSNKSYSPTGGSFESTQMKLCSNSILFANLLNWALHCAEYGNQ